MNVICVLSCIASVVFAIWFVVAVGFKKVKKAIILSIIAVICMILAIVFSTSELYEFGRIFYGMTGGLMLLPVLFFIVNKDTLKVGISLIMIALIFIFVMPRFFGTTKYSWSGEDKYSDVFDKDPNSWSKDEKEYVNDFSKWQHEYYSDN